MVSQLNYINWDKKEPMGTSSHKKLNLTDWIVKDKLFFPKEQRSVSIFTNLIQHSAGSSSQFIKTRKEYKRHMSQKGKIFNFPCEWYDYLHKNFQGIYKEYLGTKEWVEQVCRILDKHTKINYNISIY